MRWTTEETEKVGRGEHERTGGGRKGAGEVMSEGARGGDERGGQRYEEGGDGERGETATLAPIDR